MSDHGRPISAIAARTLYDGVHDDPLSDQLVTIEDRTISGIRPLPKAPERIEDTMVVDVLAPGFIDMQINGAADTQFNEEPTADALARIAAGARQGGTAHILPTFITAPNARYLHAIEAANTALQATVPGVLGIHLEGPFLSPERPGIHPTAFIRPLTRDDVEAIRRAKGTVLVTLAPEAQDIGLIRDLTAAGVLVFAGHSNATAADMRLAIEAGLTGVTHLFNAQSQVSAREPGVVGSALMRADLFAGIIADGLHVAPQNLAMAARLMGDRLCLVTDAMKTLGGTLTRFGLYGTPVTLKDGRLTGPDGTLAGAHLAMDQAVRNAVTMMGCSPAQALRMVSTNPARALGLDTQLGRIHPGYRASLSILSPDFDAVGTVVDGRLFIGDRPPS